MTVTLGIAALNSIKSLSDLVEKVRNSNDPERSRGAASEMLDLALSARAQTAALQEERNAAVIELAALKAQIENANRFEEQSKDYARQITQSGATVYREQKLADDQSPSPYFCAHCFSNKKLSILNPAKGENTMQGRYNHTCTDCGATMPLNGLRPPPRAQ